jgi:histone H3/H4
MVKDFPLSPLEKVARKAGAERISAGALKEMRVVLLEMSEKISIDAVAACNHAKRVTVKRDDIKMASRSARYG